MPDEDFFPQTSQIIRENMEAKIDQELPDDSDAINVAFFLDKDDDE